jgi:hypothetical protein
MHSEAVASHASSQHVHCNQLRSAHPTLTSLCAFAYPACLLFSYIPYVFKNVDMQGRADAHTECLPLYINYCCNTQPSLIQCCPNTSCPYTYSALLLIKMIHSLYLLALPCLHIYHTSCTHNLSYTVHDTRRVVMYAHVLFVMNAHGCTINIKAGHRIILFKYHPYHPYYPTLCHRWPWPYWWRPLTTSP